MSWTISWRDLWTACLAAWVVAAMGAPAGAVPQ